MFTALRIVAITAAALATLSIANADTFGSGENAFSIPFVTVGSPGNEADTTGAPNPAGRVDYWYRIGKYEVPEEAIRKANAASEAAVDPLGITIDDRGPQKPATRISWFEAARFVNWLNEDQGAPPAYKFDAAGEFLLWTPADPGYNPANPFRNTGARYFLPSVDEWYKAAFYDPVTEAYFDYPTGSDAPPIPIASGTDPGTAVYGLGGPADVALAGGESPWNTLAQAGNVFEWMETDFDRQGIATPDSRLIRGSDWGSVAGDPTSLSATFVLPTLADRSIGSLGFRIGSVIPEPTAISLSACIVWLAYPVRRPAKRGQHDRQAT